MAAKDTMVGQLRRRLAAAQCRPSSTHITKLAGPPSSADLQRSADAASGRGDWSTAAVHYGQLLARNPDRPELWLQHGHMLKEAGLPVQARHSYDEAASRAPGDPEIVLQLALLQKQLGQFDEAGVNLEKARSLGYPDQVFLDRELRFLHETDSRPSSSVAQASVRDTPFRLFLSSAVRTLREETAEGLGLFLGIKNYSYAFIVKGYREALDALDIPYEVLDNPEFVPDIGKRSSSEVNVHLGFYPPDSPRLLKGAYNIMVVAWEFERLQRPHELMQHHAFADPATMLGLSDEVWALSQYGSEVLRVAANLPAVSTVPTPVVSGLVQRPRTAFPSVEQQLRMLTRLEHTSWRPLAITGVAELELYGESKRRRNSLRTKVFEELDRVPPIFFLSVLNVHDARKQLRPMLEAFVQLSLKTPNAYLLLKVSYPEHGSGDVNEALMLYQVIEESDIAPILVSDRVLITTDVLSRDDMNTLYDLSAFYVCTSHGEGQNLPLLEAMGRGVVPVSVDHTAMRDYISERNAVVIPTSLQPFTIRLARRYGMRDVRTYFTSSRDVLAALRRAATLPAEEYAHRSAAALHEVRAKFGIDTFRLAVERVTANALAHASGKQGSDTP